jgi:uncharacterized membrane protein
VAAPPSARTEAIDASEHERHARPRPRIEGLADLIFGVSLGIDAIALLPTSAVTPAEMTSRILIFAFAFLFLITSWLIYTTYMSILPLETLTVTFLNVILLLFVALIPYLLNNVELGSNPGVEDFSASLFGLDLAGILVILGVFAHVISRMEIQHAAPDAAQLFRNGRNRMAILAAWVGLSIAPVFAGPVFLGVPIRFYMWSVPLVSYWLGRVVRPESRTYKAT